MDIKIYKLTRKSPGLLKVIMPNSRRNYTHLKSIGLPGYFQNNQIKSSRCNGFYLNTKIFDNFLICFTNNKTKDGL